MSNETASQEKFKHIFRGRDEWKITKNLPQIYKNISGSEKIKVFFKKRVYRLVSSCDQ